MQQIKFFTVDLTKIDGKGDFKCPRCGIEISPDDKTEGAYVIVGTNMKGDNLDNVTLQCNKCKSYIQLTGFQVLNSAR